MTTNSSTPKDDLLVDNDPLVDAVIKVAFYGEDGKLGDANETLRIKKQVGGTQIGAAYKVEVGQPTVLCFMKVPAPVSIGSRSASWERIMAEVARGRELDDIAKPDPGTGGGWSFSLPKFVEAGTISAVRTSDKSIGDYDYDHMLCGLPFILYEWIEGHQLDKLLENENNDNNLQKHAYDIRSNWFAFAEGLARMVARLHNHGFLHAYIVPRNILIDTASNSESKFYLAGFGYSSLSIEESSSPDKTIDEDAPYQAAEFKKRRQLDALWHPCDIYSVGAVLYYLATGKSPDKKGWENTDTLKTAVRTGIQAAANASNDGLRRVLENHNVASIIDNCMRHNPDDRFATVEELIEAIDIANTEPVPSSRKTEPVPPSEKTEPGPYFSAILKRRQREVKQFEERLINRPHYEIYGSRTAIVEGLCRLLAGLQDGAIYRTVTLPSYWTERNLGPDGRFLAMNKHVAKRGVTIERIFLVSGPFHTLPEEEQKILRRQSDANKELHDNFKVKVHLTDRIAVQGFERQGKAVAFVALGSDSFNELSKPKPGSFLCLNFISRGESKLRYGKEVIEREIRKVRIWDPARGQVYEHKLVQEIEQFDRYLRNIATVAVEQYIAAGSKLTLRELLAGQDNSTDSTTRGADMAT